MKKKWWIIPILLLAAGLSYGGWRWYQSRSAAANSGATAEITMQTAVVARGALRSSVEGSGNIAAATTLDLAFAASGKVAEILVAVGDVVEAGQPLARLETADLEDAVTQAQLSLLEAELKLAQTREGPEATEIAAAQASLNSAKAAYSELTHPSAAELAQAELSLHSVKLALDAAQAAYDRAGGGWRAEVEYSNVATSLWQAQLNYETELAAYNTLAAGGTDTERWAAWAKVQQAQASLAALQTSVTTNTIRLAEITVEQAQIDLAKAQRALTQATLTAPLAGTVTAVNAAVGDAAAGTAIVLGDLTALEVTIALDENDIVQVSADQEAIITLDAFDDLALSGAVVAIAPVAAIQSGVALYPVTVALSPTAAAVRSGMTADVEILTANLEDVLLIPLNAVQNLGGRTVVLRQLREGETLETALAGAFGPGGGNRQQLPGGNAAQRPEMGQTPSTGNGSAAAPGMGARGRLAQLSSGGFAPVIVELGAQTDTEVAVLSGLEEGDVISLGNIAATTGQEFQRPFGGGEMVPPPDGGGPGQLQPL